MCCTCSAAISTKPSRWRSSERRRQMASSGRKEVRSNPTECKYCNHWQSATSLLRPGTCLTWRELYQTDFYPPRLQNLKQRDPVDPGRFHGYGPNAASEQPGRQRLEVFRKSLEATNRVRIPVRRDRYVDFGGSYIDPGCIRLDTFQTGNCSTSAGAFVSHRSSLLCHRTGQVVGPSNLPNGINALQRTPSPKFRSRNLGPCSETGSRKSAKVSDGLLPAPWQQPLYCYHRNLFIPVSTCPSRSVARDDKTPGAYLDRGSAVSAWNLPSSNPQSPPGLVLGSTGDVLR